MRSAPALAVAGVQVTEPPIRHGGRRDALSPPSARTPIRGRPLGLGGHEAEPRSAAYPRRDRLADLPHPGVPAPLRRYSRRPDEHPHDETTRHSWARHSGLEPITGASLRQARPPGRDDGDRRVHARRWAEAEELHGWARTGDRELRVATVLGFARARSAPTASSTQASDIRQPAGCHSGVACVLAQDQRECIGSSRDPCEDHERGHLLRAQHSNAVTART